MNTIQENMLTLLLAISICLTIVAVLGSVYHLFWATVGLYATTRSSARRRKRDSVTTSAGTSAASTRFAILIPAHNEASILDTTLRSCLALDYPQDRYTIFVIADNCTDKTADVATSFGVECLQRINPYSRGKGHALAWAMPKVLQQADAVVILDADCVLDSHSLRCIDRRMRQGADAVQLNYVVGNPETSSMSFLLAAANRLENDYYYAPKSLLHAAVLLRGTGMAMRREIMDRFPWDAFSIAEDTEHSLTLLENGIEIEFVQEAKVLSEFPTQHETLAVQRTRWIGGTLRLSLFHGLRLLAIGLTTFRWRLVDTGMTLLTLSRPLVMAQLAAAWIFTSCTARLLPQSSTNPLVIGLLLATLGYMAYACLGIFALHRETRRLTSLLRVPIDTLTYLTIAARSIVDGPTTVWQKTPR